MSRKHPPIPPTDLVLTLQAIARRRNEILEEGHALGSLVMVLDPALWDAVRPLWGTSPEPGFLRMRAERDERATGWTVRVKG